MSEILQNILAGLIVSVAVGYVLLRFCRLIRGNSTGHCGGCSGCHTSNNSAQPPKGESLCGKTLYPHELGRTGDSRRPVS